MTAMLAFAVLTPNAARADFFDGMRKTFKTDIPHFFQDDIPCAFGGQPTSHTKTSCKSGKPSEQRTPAAAGDRAKTAPRDSRGSATKPTP